MRGGLEKSARKFYAGCANPTCFLQAKCGAGLCKAGEPMQGGPTRIATPIFRGFWGLNVAQVKSEPVQSLCVQSLYLSLLLKLFDL